MLGFLIFALVGVSSVHATAFDVSVSNDAGALAYNPPFIANASTGDQITFHFFPKNHTVTQSTFDKPCDTLLGGFDSDFRPVTNGTTDTYQVILTSDDQPFWFHCKQPVGSHCGNGMVFAVNPPPDGPMSFDNFVANARATLNNSTLSPFSTPPPQPFATATATLTNGTSILTSTYTSYLGSVSPTIAPAVQHNVTVGADGLFRFDPQNITAGIGDTILFEFHPKNHTVTQSTFSDPCQPKAGGFDSGFMPVDANQTDNFPTFSIIVNDTAPVWVHCAQTGHCAAGMVFAINAVETGSNNFENFQVLANRTGSTTSSSSSPGSTTSATPGNNNSAALSRPHMSGLIFGILLFMASLL